MGDRGSQPQGSLTEVVAPFPPLSLVTTQECFFLFFFFFSSFFFFFFSKTQAS